MKVKVIKVLQNFIEFDLLHADPSIANALRRTMLAEVPTMAIETVFVINNTSVIHDEVLSHRLGLVPLRADPRKFDFPTPGSSTDVNTIVFELRKKHSRKSSIAGADNVEQVMSGDIVWIPQGSQQEVFATDPIKPLLDDIILTKLAPGQEVDVELHAVKGIGKEHAKWSPVAAASYRLMPTITFLQPIKGDMAEKFATMFPVGVIKVEGPERVAKVANARLDTVSRECLRHEEFADKVVLGRDPSHYLFQVESTSIYSPSEVVDEALGVLIQKCRNLRSIL